MDHLFFVSKLQIEQYQTIDELTKHPAIVQFPHGNSLIPNSFGSAYMMYNNTMNPALSIVAHPIFPSMFHFDSIDVLPCGYQSSTHCAVVTCESTLANNASLRRGYRSTYEREVRPDGTYEFPVLARRREPVLEDGHWNCNWEVRAERRFECVRICL
jgi:hypothetical protein